MLATQRFGSICRRFILLAVSNPLAHRHLASSRHCRVFPELDTEARVHLDGNNRHFAFYIRLVSSFDHSRLGFEWTTSQPGGGTPGAESRVEYPASETPWNVEQDGRRCSSGIKEATGCNPAGGFRDASGPLEKIGSVLI